jgi:chromate transporter
MARTLCPDRVRASIAGIAVLILVFSASAMAQIGTIVMGAIAGWWLCPGALDTEAADSLLDVVRTYLK